MNRFLILVGKELRVEARTREMLTGGLFLMLLVVVLSHLAWGSLGQGARLLPGVLWIAFTFAGVLSLSRNLHRERDRGTWEALALLPVDRGTVFLSKAAANFLLLLALEFLTLPLVVGLFRPGLGESLLRLLPILALGTLGFSAAGTLMAAASSHGRAREVLLPILLFPLLLPLLMMGVQATQKVLDGALLFSVGPELQVLVAFDAMFLAIGWLTFDYLLGD